MANSQGLRPGTLLHGGTYRIEKILGQGSFGITYLASAKFEAQGNLGRMNVEAQVAVKEFFMSEVNGRKADGSSVDGSSGSVFANYRKRFRREAENLSHLHHFDIVKVLDIFDENNTTYYAMEFIEGQNLDDYICRRGGVPEAEALSIIREAGDALTYMHSRRLLHLDLKPKNIMRRPDGTVCLIDFGLSKQFTANGEPESSTTIGLGTPGYAPIEQGSYKPGGRFPATLDVYALGATLFKLLTGQRPPDATDILSEGFPKKELSAHRISSGTIEVLRKAMAPKKDDRYQSISSFVEDIGGGIDEATTFIDEATTIVGEPVKQEYRANPPSKPKQAPAGAKSRPAKSKSKDSGKTGKASDAPKPQSAPAAPSPTYNLDSQSKPSMVETREGWKWFKRLIIASVVALLLLIGYFKFIVGPKTLYIGGVQMVSSVGKSVDSPTEGSIAGHDYVDLGLSVKWATCNIGASSPSDYGDYFAWGETSTKSEYEEKNSKTYGKEMSDIAGDSAYDAARANWGASWRLPTKAELEELEEKCTWTWTTEKGHNGYRVKGPNGKFIFLPAAGWQRGSTLSDAGRRGEYWSSTPHTDITGRENHRAYSLGFSDFLYMDMYYRNDSRSVRPVSE